MSNYAIKIANLGKMYRLYQRPTDKILDAFGLNFWRKNYYQEFWALRNFSLEVKKGERLGIIGRNGAGKSTLLKIITGNVSPTEGIVDVEGRIQALMEIGTGFHPEFTGRQNIKASLAYQGYSPKQIEEKEIDIIEFAELEEFIDQPVRTYSAGMYARLAFSAATAIEPEILIIDEVLGAGDAYFTGKCVERMQKLTEDSGATVLFVSHDLNSVQQLCDRVIWVDRGRTMADGKPLYVVKAYTAVVRKEEQIRLRARDLKVLKKQAVLLDRNEDVYQSLLFHLVCLDGKRPVGRNRIYRIRLLSGDEEVSAIEVGGPMDNSPDQLNYLLDTPGFMDWGTSLNDERGTYREYVNAKSKYKHAPFEMVFPKSYDNRSALLRLEITADVEDDYIAVEVFGGKAYKKLGSIKRDGFRAYDFDLAELFMSDQSDYFTGESDVRYEDSDTLHLDENEKDLSEYGSMEAQITAVSMKDHLGRESKVFEVGRSLKVIFEFNSIIELKEPVFVFCIYFADSRCASQWVADSTMYNASDLNRKGKFIFFVDSLLLGKGSYVASAAIFRRLSGNGLEAESYHVLDRCIHFQVVQKFGDNIDRGLCLQPYKVELLNG